MIIQRPDYLNRIKPFIGKDLIKVITGLRRSGKSVILKLIQKELKKQKIPDQNIIYYNFEDFQNRKLLNPDLLNEEIINRTKNLSGKIFLFFDEIQEVHNWEKVINSFRLNPDFDLYITGSNAKLLSSELSTYLAGRYIEFQIYPFTFSEFRELYLFQFPKSSIDEIFEAYLKFGGMPYLSQLDFNIDNSIQYLEDLYNSVFVKDIIKRNKIRDIDLLERIIYFLIDNDGQSFSANSIAKYFKSENRKVSVDSILNYLKACEEAFLISIVKKENINGKKALRANDKVYLADHGFLNLIPNSNKINQILENIVLNELLKRNYKVTVGNNNEKEVDFIAQKGNKKIYIQVSYLLADESVINREFRSLENIQDNYPKYVLSKDKLDFSRNGIIHRNIIDFLLDETW